MNQTCLGFWLRCSLRARRLSAGCCGRAGSVAEILAGEGGPAAADPTAAIQVGQLGPRKGMIRAGQSS